jgi:hypothetical protein
MTDEQRAALRDAWLSELWPVCREHHQTKDERLDAQARNDLLTERRERRGAA